MDEGFITIIMIRVLLFFKSLASDFLRQILNTGHNLKFDSELTIFEISIGRFSNEKIS